MISQEILGNLRISLGPAGRGGTRRLTPARQMASVGGVPGIPRLGSCVAGILCRLCSGATPLPLSAAADASGRTPRFDAASNHTGVLSGDNYLTQISGGCIIAPKGG